MWRVPYFYVSVEIDPMEVLIIRFSSWRYRGIFYGLGVEEGKGYRSGLSVRLLRIVFLLCIGVSLVLGRRFCSALRYLR